MAVTATLFLATPLESELFALGAHMPISGSVRLAGLAAGDIFPGLVQIDLIDGAGRLLGDAILRHETPSPPGQRIDFDIAAPPGPAGKRADFYWTSFAIPGIASGRITVRVTFLPIAGGAGPILERIVRLPGTAGGPPAMQGTADIRVLQPRRMPIPRFKPGDSVDVAGDAPVGNDYIYVNGTEEGSAAVVDAALGGIDGAGRFGATLKMPGGSMNLRLNARAVCREGARVFGAEERGVFVQVVAPPAAKKKAGGFGLAAPRRAVKKKAPAGGGSKKVNVNRATLDELTTLKGIGPVIAGAIVARRASGNFKRPEDLLAVEGIGPAKLAAIRGSIRC